MNFLHLDLTSSTSDTALCGGSDIWDSPNQLLTAKNKDKSADLGQQHRNHVYSALDEARTVDDLYRIADQLIYSAKT